MQMIFRKRALIRNQQEWDEIRSKNRDGDGIHHCYIQSFPALLLETHNPKGEEYRGLFEDKAYVVICAEDIKELLK
jgi:hypothetical protein